jgi:hypothetical protein
MDESLEIIKKLQTDVECWKLQQDEAMQELIDAVERLRLGNEATIAALNYLTGKHNDQQ